MELTSAERFFAKSMGVLAIAFLVAGLVFVLANEPLIRVVNVAGNWLGMPAAPYEGLVPGSGLDQASYSGAVAAAASTLGPCKVAPVHHLWLALTFALMMMISYMSLLIWRDVRTNLNLAPPLMLSKLVSSGTGLTAFYLSRGYFADLLIVFVDFPIFLFVLVAYWRAKRSREDF
ncbi:MAG: hypothetical protein P9M14_11640 [Candidatus Alcyoniella australis]|nr:hypothetical protein [Candidatus Alcyoniella australis]